MHLPAKKESSPIEGWMSEKIKRAKSELPRAVQDKLSDEYVCAAVAYVLQNSLGDARRNALLEMERIFSSPNYRPESEAEWLYTIAKDNLGPNIVRGFVKVREEVEGRREKKKEKTEFITPPKADSVYIKAPSSPIIEDWMVELVNKRKDKIPQDIKEKMEKNALLYASVAYLFEHGFQETSETFSVLSSLLSNPKFKENYLPALLDLINKAREYEIKLLLDSFSSLLVDPNFKSDWLNPKSPEYKIPELIRKAREEQ